MKRQPGVFGPVRMSHAILLCLLFFALFPQAEAADPASDTSSTQAPADAPWSPQYPTPDDFDWIQLTSDEWLKGELKVLYEETLEFDSDELGLLELDWEDIKQLRGGRDYSIQLSGQREMVGRIGLSEEKLVVVTQDRRAEFRKDEIISIAPHGKRERSYWAFKLSAGLNFSSGNTEQADYNLKANAKRRTAKNRMLFNYLGSFSETEDIETDNNHRLSGQYDIFSSKDHFWRPAWGEYFRDTFQNIAHRVTLGAGIGYHLINTSKTEWDVFGGPAFQYTEFDSVVEGEDISEQTPALVLSTDYETELSKRIDLIAGYQLQLGNQASGGYIHHAISTLETELIDDFDFDVSLIWDYTQYPTPRDDGSVPEKDDFKLIFGVGLDI